MTDPTPPRCLAVFHGDGHGFLARFLKPGFRHCFVAVLNKNCWVVIDGRNGVPDIDVFAQADYDLATFFRGQGFTVIETVQRGQAPRSPFAVANCVGLVKAILCVRSAAITPHGLYKHLRKYP